MDRPRSRWMKIICILLNIINLTKQSWSFFAPLFIWPELMHIWKGNPHGRGVECSVLALSTPGRLLCSCSRPLHWCLCAAVTWAENLRYRRESASNAHWLCSFIWGRWCVFQVMTWHGRMLSISWHSHRFYFETHATSAITDLIKCQPRSIYLLV